jgi:hypothetical protein
MAEPGTQKFRTAENRTYYLSAIDKWDLIQSVRLYEITIVDLNGTIWCTKDSRIVPHYQGMIDEIQAVPLSCWQSL